MTRMMATRQQLAPQVQTAAEPQVVRVQQKAGGGVVRSTIDLAKFVLAFLFLAMIGTCVYVCGSAAKATKATNSVSPVERTEPTANEPSTTPSTTLTMDDSSAMREQFASEFTRAAVTRDMTIAFSATGTEGRTLTVAAFGMSCDRDGLRAVAKEIGDKLREAGFRKMACAQPEGMRAIEIAIEAAAVAVAPSAAAKKKRTNAKPIVREQTDEAGSESNIPDPTSCVPGQWERVISIDAGRKREEWAARMSRSTGRVVVVAGCEGTTVVLPGGGCDDTVLSMFEAAHADEMNRLRFARISCSASGPHLPR